MTCYECGRKPGEIRCKYTDGCPHGEYDGPEDWACIPAELPCDMGDDGQCRHCGRWVSEPNPEHCPHEAPPDYPA